MSLQDRSSPGLGPSAPIIPAAVDEAELIAPLDSSEPPADDNSPSLGSSPSGQFSLLPEVAKPPLPEDGIPLAERPPLRRDKSIPSPAPLPPAPAPPAPSDGPNATDSLSLMQLKRIVTDMPKIEPTPYAFEYSDASSFGEEMEEWFSYSIEERAMILKAQSSFQQEWKAYRDLDASVIAIDDVHALEWAAAGEEARGAFIGRLLDDMESEDSSLRIRKSEAIVYLALGCWQETAGLPVATSADQPSSNSDRDHAASANLSYVKSGKQMEWMKTNTEMIAKLGGIPKSLENMRNSCNLECGVEGSVESTTREAREAEKRETWCDLTLMYLFIELARPKKDGPSSTGIRKELLELAPRLLEFLVDLIDRIRWDESIALPLTKILLLTWKTILVAFGGLEDVDRAKMAFRDDSLETEDKRGQPLITASPLDYHLFRQEISSKYPAYEPPPPLFPLEPENNSILPPLRNHHSKASGNNIFGANVATLDADGTSILNQPVHIATPAPSPPPSPAGPGGKGGKKQNYQTNNLFPFLYPPLDESSNNLGGTGSTEVQDLLVGRKWEGSDIPASILEAAELFAKRMRATRAMKQLWEERIQFMKYERGWSGTELSKEGATTEIKGVSGGEEPLNTGDAELDEDIRQRLEQVEGFYKMLLPKSQSLSMVLLKVILANVSQLIIQANGPNGQGGGSFSEGQNGAPHTNGVNGSSSDIPGTLDDLDAVRGQEILAKAVSGILILLLKWFKVSHILKFEYLTQLLLDSNYMALILKLLQSQELERTVNYKAEREDLNFFAFCLAHSRQAEDDGDSGEDSDESESDEGHEEQDDEDDAVPPPIKLRRESKTAEASESAIVDEGAASPSTQPPPPEVDELGIPISAYPVQPITTYSWRNFFSSINFLRVLQKICKGKVHRNLLLVHYKSSQFLKKCLKVPQPQLRLYTLKLFKNQVPYCGRKWRQGNMRVITAVYLHCRPELRDDWLAGAEVDAGVDESLPLEQALRALTHWHNLNRYPDSMGADEEMLKSGQDFFVRELEKIGWLDQMQMEMGEEEQWEGPLAVDVNGGEW